MKVHLGDALAIVSLGILLVSPALIVEFTLIEPPFPIRYYFTVWDLTTNALPPPFSATFSFLWILLAVIQALNLMTVSRRKYWSSIAWVIFFAVIVVQFLAIPSLFNPLANIPSDAIGEMFYNPLPTIVIAFGLLFLGSESRPHEPSQDFQESRQLEN